MASETALTCEYLLSRQSPYKRRWETVLTRGPNMSVTGWVTGRNRLKRTDREWDGWAPAGSTWHRPRVLCLLGINLDKTEAVLNWAYRHINTNPGFHKKTSTSASQVSDVHISSLNVSNRNSRKEFYAMATERKKSHLHYSSQAVTLPLEISMNANSQGECLQSLLQI